MEPVGRPWLFAMTLCFSRYSYYELVLDQTVPTFQGAIRRGFEDFGGAPERLKPDNLRSAVLISSLGERYYQEDFWLSCRFSGSAERSNLVARSVKSGLQVRIEAAARAG